MDSPSAVYALARESAPALYDYIQEHIKETATGEGYLHPAVYGAYLWTELDNLRRLKRD